jgi:8-oxo-dGTP pyrophosphatase MutT (NUDIX family)
MRQVFREIVTAYILSNDGMILLGRKPAGTGAVYPDCLHNPGGGVDIGESKVAALQREIREETGLQVDYDQVTLIDDNGAGKSLKTIDGEDAMVSMQFNVYRVQINCSYKGVIVQEGDDLIGFEWYPTKDILMLPLAPPAFELFDRIGVAWLYKSDGEGK